MYQNKAERKRRAQDDQQKRGGSTPAAPSSVTLGDRDVQQSAAGII
jgi:hypothetical protein